MREKGFAQIFPLLILLVGLGAGLYLIKHETSLFSKAAGPSQKVNIKSIITEENKVAGINQNGKLNKEKAELLAKINPQRYQELVKRGLIENPTPPSPTSQQRSLSTVPVTVINDSQVTSCGEITSSGNYVLTKDITTSGGVCINIHDVSNVNIDCQNHSITAFYNPDSPYYDPGINSGLIGVPLLVRKVEKFSLKNCSSIHSTATDQWIYRIGKYKYYNPESIYILNSKDGVIQNNTIGDGPVWIEDSQDLQFLNNVVNTFYIQIKSSSNKISNNTFKLSPPEAAATVAYVVWSANGTSNTIENNSIDGGWNSVSGPFDDNSTGADDGILLSYESSDIVSGNVISNNYDCGIETEGFIKDTKIVNNRTNQGGLCGIGAWHRSSWLNNLVDSNTVDNSAYMLYFFLSHRRVEGGQTIYFKDNTFSNNTFLNQRGDSYIGLTKQYSSLVDLQNLPYWLTDKSSVELGNNIFKNNDFNNTLPAPVLIPSSMIVDQGGNKCLPVNDAMRPLACSTPTPAPTPTPTITPSPTPTPKPIKPKVCKVGVSTFSVGSPCSSTTFRSAKYVCYDGIRGTVGDNKSCQTSQTLLQQANTACAGHSSCVSKKPN